MVAERVCVGIIVGAHGVRGRVRIKSFTTDPVAVGAYGPVQDENGSRVFNVRVSSSSGKGVVLAELADVTDRDQAEALRGVRLYVPRSALPPPEDEDEFYWNDLIGLAVVLDDGTAAGRVRAVHDFGAGAVVEVDGADRRSVMVPFTRAVVPVVDLKAGHLVVTSESGVFDPPNAEDAEDGPHGDRTGGTTAEADEEYDSPGAVDEDGT